MSGKRYYLWHLILRPWNNYKYNKQRRVMKIMHFVPAFCVALILSAGSLSAQSKAFGVTLTPAQQEQFKAMNVAAEPSKKAIRENTTLSEDEKRTQMKAVYDGIKEKLKAILTPEQLKEIEAAQKK